METLVKLNTQTAGRDKIARLLQYLSRLLWHKLHNKDSINGLKNLEFQLSTFRKLLRFGRCIDSLYSTLALLNHPDSTVRHTLVLSKIANSLFLLADHILWLGRADVCSINTEKWSRTSNKYWLYSITMNLVRDFYELSCLFSGQRGASMKFNSVRDCYRFICYNRGVFVDLLKNGCDFFIPLSALGHVKLSPGTVGLLGVISSIAGLMVLIEPESKLIPV